MIVNNLFINIILLIDFSTNNKIFVLLNFCTKSSTLSYWNVTNKKGCQFVANCHISFFLHVTETHLECLFLSQTFTPRVKFLTQSVKCKIARNFGQNGTSEPKIWNFQA